MFAHKTRSELSDIWQKLFLPGLSASTGRPQLNPIELDEMLIKEYGQYETSLADFITNKFGKEVLKALLN